MSSTPSLDTLRAQGGYILLGVILSLAFASISVGVAVTVYSRNLDSEFSDETEAELAEIESALEDFYEDVGSYPAQLADLVKKPAGVGGWMGPYVSATFADLEANGQSVLRDAWRANYAYPTPVGASATVTSLGIDGVDSAGAGDDLSAQADATPTLWKRTRWELRVLKAGIAAFNHAGDQSLPNNWSSAVARLQAFGFLPSGKPQQDRFAVDEWNQGYVTIGAPKITEVSSRGAPNP